MELAPGAEIAGYRIEGVIGRGGMGVVYRAAQLALDRAVALKVIAPELAQDAAFRERFKRESRLAAQIEHPNVIPVHEAGEHDGVLYITMRYVEGTDLRALVAREGRLAPPRAAAIVAQVAAALDAAHACGLVHRDVKPANVLVAAGDHAYLTDFGLTKQVTSQGGLTRTGQFVGTLDYIAPEQLQARRVDARTDVYALGCVLFETLTGRVPFPRDSEPAKLWAHMSEPPPALRQVRPDVPAEFEAVIGRALAKEPDGRFPSAGDLGRAALAAAEGRTFSEPGQVVAAGEAAPAPSAVLPTAAARDLPTHPEAPLVRPGTATGPTHPLAPPPPPPPGGGRSVVLVAAGTAVLLAAGAVVAVLALSGGDEQPAEREGAVRTTIETVTAPAAPTKPGPPVTRSEVESRLNTYATLYTAEGARQIADMLAPDVVRRNGSDPPQDRDEAIAEYERQFRTLVKPVYTIDIESIDVGDGDAAAEARYRIDADNAPAASGAIDFHLVRSEFDLLIDEIRIQPD